MHLPWMQGTELGNSRWGTWKHEITVPLLFLSSDSHRVTRDSGLTLDEDPKDTFDVGVVCQEPKNIYTL